MATKVCSQICRKWNAMFKSYVVTSVNKTSFDFRYEDILSNLPLWTFIYCVTDQPSITRSRRYVLKFKLSVLAFWAAPWALSKTCAKWKNISTPIYVECVKMYRSRFAVKNSRISSLAMIFKLKNPSIAVLYAKKSVAGGEIRRVIYRIFRAIDINQWLRWVAVSQATWVRILLSAETLCQA